MPPPRAKVPPYLLPLLVSFALLGIIGYQTLKNRTFSADLLEQKDFAIHQLEQLLQKGEKRVSELQKRLAKLSSQKNELNGMREGLSSQLLELGRVKSLTEDDKRKLESTLKATEEEIQDLKDKLALFDETQEELKLIKAEMAQKDAEILELKAQLKTGGDAGPGGNQGLLWKSSEQARKTHEESKPAIPETGIEEVVGLERGHVATIEKHKGDGSQAEVGGSNDNGMESVKEEGHESKEGDGSKDGELRMEEVDSSEKSWKASSLEGADEESLVDDRDFKANDKGEAEEEEEEEAHEEEVADDTKKGQEEVDDDMSEKAHAEEQGQLDVDMEVINKANLEENEMAARE